MKKLIRSFRGALGVAGIVATAVAGSAEQQATIAENRRSAIHKTQSRVDEARSTITNGAERIARARADYEADPTAANAGSIAGLTVPAVWQAATAPGASAPWAGWAFLAAQPYLSIFSYALVLGGLVLAFWHRLLVADLSARLRADGESLRATLGTFPGAPLHRCQLESLIHPAARVLLTLDHDPRLRSRIPELFDIQVLELLMPLSNRSQGNQGRSVFFGFLGTLLGILCGSLAYDKSNTGLLLQNIGLALITTMIGGVAAEIEAATLRKLDWIHLQLQAGRPASIEQLAASPLPVAEADVDHRGSVEDAPALTP